MPADVPRAMCPKLQKNVIISLDKTNFVQVFMVNTNDHLVQFSRGSKSYALIRNI
jgi:hypothetical protein